MLDVSVKSLAKEVEEFRCVDDCVRRFAFSGAMRQSTKDTRQSVFVNKSSIVDYGPLLRTSSGCFSRCAARFDSSSCQS